MAQGVFPVGADRVIALGSDPGPVDPAVAVDGARRSVNAWWIQDYSSGSDELAQAWSCNWTGQPLAGVIQVNTDTSTSAQVPAVGARDDGGFVVVWQQVGDGVLGQRFSSPDTRVGDEFGVESSTTGGADPRIAMNAGGAFVVVWEANGVDGSGTSIHARRFAADTTPEGDDFQVNTYTAGNQLEPTVGIASDGSFCVAWQSFNQDGSEWGVFARCFDASGVAATAEIQVNVTTTGSQSRPELGMAGDGRFVVVWEGADGGSDSDIWGRRYSSAGTPLGGEFTVNSLLDSENTAAGVAADLDGGFLVVWAGDDPGGDVIYARQFDSAGDPLGTEYQVSSEARFQGEPAVAGDGSGEFYVVLWQEGDSVSGGTLGIRQRMLATGDPIFVDGFDGPETCAWAMTVPSCDDGVDNDGDGWADADDPDCNSPWCRFVEFGYGSTACNDGIDNDGDLLVDADDPGCDDGFDDNEFND